jgi:hypothetical protein
MFMQRLFPWILSVLLLAAEAAWAQPKTIKIGVLSHRGDPATLFRWTPTAEYLSYKLPDYRFEIVPLDFAQVTPAVAGATVDFILVNPGIYVNLEVLYRVSRIATLNNRRGEEPGRTARTSAISRISRTAPSWPWIRPPWAASRWPGGSCTARG